MTREEKKKLPEGWEWVRLGEVCEINPRKQRNSQIQFDAPCTFIPMEAVNGLTGSIQTPRIRPYHEVAKGYTYFQEGDVLFAKITPCMQNGKHAIGENLIDGVGFASTEFHVLRPSSMITNTWIHFYIRQPHILREAKRYFTGAVGQQRVPPAFLRELKIPLPPPDEQKRIVARLDGQIAAVERARLATEEQLASICALPDSLLRQAFSGVV